MTAITFYEHYLEVESCSHNEDKQFDIINRKLEIDDQRAKPSATDTKNTFCLASISCTNSEDY
jgi:hypothetical protein